MTQDWITTAEAAQITGYHPVHIRRLAITGKINAQRFGRAWMVSRASLVAYLSSTEHLGDKRGPKPAS